MSLLYATDFYDQLVNEIIPALRAGYIVLADRYIYTLMARDIVRGAERAWTRNLYSPALLPDAVFYFRVGARQSRQQCLILDHRRYPDLCNHPSPECRTRHR